MFNLEEKIYYGWMDSAILEPNGNTRAPVVITGKKRNNERTYLTTLEDTSTSYSGRYTTSIPGPFHVHPRSIGSHDDIIMIIWSSWYHDHDHMVIMISWSWSYDHHDIIMMIWWSWYHHDDTRKMTSSEVRSEFILDSFWGHPAIIYGPSRVHPGLVYGFPRSFWSKLGRFEYDLHSKSIFFLKKKHFSPDLLQFHGGVLGVADHVFNGPDTWEKAEHRPYGGLWKAP